MGLIQDSYLVNAASMERDPLVQALLLAELDDVYEPLSGVQMARQVAEQLLPLSVLKGHDQGVTSATFSPDGSQIATASKNTTRLWPVDGKGEQAVLRGHTGWVRAAAFSPDSRWLATASADGTVRLWTVDSFKGPLILRGHEDQVADVAFSPDGRHIATASQDGTVRLWPVEGERSPLILRDHKDAVGRVVFNPDGTLIKCPGLTGYPLALNWRVWGFSPFSGGEGTKRLRRITLR